jgi:hypothetical protein
MWPDSLQDRAICFPSGAHNGPGGQPASYLLGAGGGGGYPVLQAVGRENDK